MKVRGLGLALAAVVGLATPIAAGATAPSSSSSSNAYVFNGYVDGMRFIWTVQDQDLQNARWAVEQRALFPNAAPSTSTGISPQMLPGPGSSTPSSAQVTIGLGDWTDAHNQYDTSITSSTPPNQYLTMESPTANTCGPIAAHNTLTFFGPAPNYIVLEPQVGYDGTQTPWSDAYANALNANDGGKYDYQGFDYQSTTATSWQDGFENIVYATGDSDVSTAMSAIGDLPAFGGAYVPGHWFTPFGYSGWGTNNPNQEDVDYFDESELHSGFWFTSTLTQFEYYTNPTTGSVYYNTIGGVEG